MSPEDLKFLQDNAPDATEEQIREAFDSQKGKLVEVLAVLLDAPKVVVKEPNEWEKRREVFDELDRQMMLKKRA